MRNRLWPGDAVRRAASVLLAAGLLATGCAPAAQPAPTAPTAPTVPQPAASPALSPTTVASPLPGASPAASPSAAGAAGIGKPLEEMSKPAGRIKDTIVLALGQNPSTLHPLISAELSGAEILYSLFTWPVANDNRGEWVPIGVEQVPTIDNGGAKFVGDGDDRHLEVTFKIKPGIKWSDGTPTTSKDIQYAWKLNVDPKFPSPDRGQSIKVAAIDTPDDRTAVVKYMSARQARDAAGKGAYGLEAKEWEAFKDQKEPLVDPFYFAPPTGPANPGWLPEHILSKIPADQQEKSDYARSPVGNGPYTLKEWIADQSLTLEANPNFFMGAPPTKTVVFRIIPNSNSEIAAAQAGEVDAILQPNGPDVNNAQELERLQGYKAYFIPGTAWEHIDLYTPDPALADKNVRKALIYGINRQEIIDKILAGRTKIATSWIQPGVPAWAYDASCATTYTYDPAQAQKLLEQSGYVKGGDGIYAKGGQPLQFKLQTTNAVLRQNVSQVIQANLKTIGVQLDLEFLPAGSFFGQQGPLTRGQFQLGLYTWIASPDPDAVSLYASKSIPTAENSWSGQNYPRFSNPRMDDLLIRGAQELDTAKRKPIYCDAVKLWTEEVPVIPLFQRPITTTARQSLANFRPTPTQTPETWNLFAWYVPA